MQIEIRDRRRKEMFKMDDEYLNGYAKLCGPWSTLVYVSLCRHAGKGEEAFPSIELLASELAISEPTVLKGIKNLEKWEIIFVKREKDKKTKRQKKNIYVLIDKSYWKPKPGKGGLPGAGSTSGASRVNVGGKSRVNDVECKDGHQGEGYTIKEGLASLSKREQIEQFGFTLYE